MVQENDVHAIITTGLNIIGTLMFLCFILMAIGRVFIWCVKKIRTIKNEVVKWYTVGNLININVSVGYGRYDKILTWDHNTVFDLFKRLQTRIQRDKETFSFEFNDELYKCNERSKSTKLSDIGLYEGAHIYIQYFASTARCDAEEAGPGPAKSQNSVRNVIQRGRGRGGGGGGVYRPYAASGQAPPPSAKQPTKKST